MHFKVLFLDSAQQITQELVKNIENVSDRWLAS